MAGWCDSREERRPTAELSRQSLHLVALPGSCRHRPERPQHASPGQKLCEFYEHGCRPGLIGMGCLSPEGAEQNEWFVACYALTGLRVFFPVQSQGDAALCPGLTCSSPSGSRPADSPEPRPPRLPAHGQPEHATAPTSVLSRFTRFLDFTGRMCLFGIISSALTTSRPKLPSRLSSYTGRYLRPVKPCASSEHARRGV